MHIIYLRKKESMAFQESPRANTMNFVNGTKTYFEMNVPQCEILIISVLFIVLPVSSTA
jgi:hypothetical protein